MSRRLSFETYVIDICDELLGTNSSRQHRFNFLRGDPGRSGRSVRLPVDAFYPSLKLCIEFHEAQHTRSVAHFDKPDRMTVSGVHRGEQRRLYDERRRSVLPRHGLTLIEIDHTILPRWKPGGVRDRGRDVAAIRAALESAGVDFIAENGGGPWVRLRK